jgi:cobalt-zinc-cadmium resistance protein CzcA
VSLVLLMYSVLVAALNNQIQIDSLKMRNYKLTLTEVYRAVADNNANIGGNFIEYGDEALVVRGIGLLRSLDEIKETVLTSRNSTSVFVKISPRWLLACT